MSKIGPTEVRKDVIIRYYPHQADGNKVYLLSDYGFYIHERPVDPEYLGLASNSLFYGDDVPLRDIKLIAYLLLQNGVELKQIIPSKFHDSWKSGSVEVGTDLDAENYPTLTEEEIVNLKK
jgi:hypothetical protein